MHNMIRKKNLWLSTALMLMLGSCSTNDSITGAISLSDVSHSECQSHSSSRTQDYVPSTFDDLYPLQLRLTYNEADETITGEYINYLISCDYKDAGMNVEQDADGTLILNPWNESPNLVDCLCPVNIYFTIRNANRENYHLVLNRRTVNIIGPDGSKHLETRTDYDNNISFKKQSVITINLSHYNN